MPPSTKSSRTSTSVPNPYKTPHKTNKAPTKRAKRDSKHAILLSRITKTAPGSKIKKRRRPSKKLVTNLKDLADALPDTPADRPYEDPENAGLKGKQKSLKSRPGAQKKKEKLVAMETERFRQNLAVMAAGSTKKGKDDGDGAGEVGEEKWAAIRHFINSSRL